MTYTNRINPQQLVWLPYKITDIAPKSGLRVQPKWRIILTGSPKSLGQFARHPG